MDALSSAASVIAVIQLTGSLVKLCGGYIQEVKDARDEIFTLQKTITGLQGTLQDLLKLLQNNDAVVLINSSRLASTITDCLCNLQALEAKVDPGKGKKLMRKVGLRSLKWPLKRAEVEGSIQNLERYKASFLLSLQVDQTSVIVGVAQNTDRMNQNMDLAKLEGVIEAGFDSFANRNEVQCLQGTRTELLQQIMEWAISPSQKSIFWLKGMAGTGKSTISRTVAGLLKDANYLGASFFFKRGEGDRGNARKFFLTLIRQLMLRISELRSSVHKALDNDPDITSKSLREQFEKLLLQPLLYLGQLGQQPQTAVIVIDALDECENDQDIRNILRLLPLLQKAKAVRLRIFLTSRPELPISLGFAEITDHEYQGLALHEIPEEVTEHDIRLFLQDRFTKIRHDRCIVPDWPDDDALQQLVTMSVPLFISAATVCRYIENSRWEPKSRLAELLRDQAKYASRMDKTYLPILTRLLDDQDVDESEQHQLLQEFQNIVGVIILLAVPLSINALSLFLGIEADQISSRLDSFRSVISIPGNKYQPVRILHLSFRDFLVRSETRFRVNEPKKHKDIAHLCLKSMQNHLHKNICKLSSPGTYRADLDAQSLHKYLPEELRYSCRYWIYHLKHSNTLISEMESVLDFLQKHFLHWVEAMSLLGLASEVVGMVDSLQNFFSGGNCSAMSEFLQDAKRFVLKNCYIADVAPLQLYCSGLLFAPQSSEIRKYFEAEIPTWILQLPLVDKAWNMELQTLEAHKGPVHSVAFSSDGQLLASGSHDNMIQLWDITTSTLQQTLEGHTSDVWSVVFSPDNQLLASGSHDNTVRLWDTATGMLQRIFEGHSGCVFSVVFSPNGQLLASGSKGKIHVWDITMGTLQQTFEGHSDLFFSVAFSPNGRMMASGSRDSKIRLWDVTTGDLQQTFEGHSGPVHSVAFSPNGQVLASSCDKLVKLWDVMTGALQRSYEGHTDRVRSVAFSPDSRLVASGSWDKTVRLWDAVTGELQQILEGHSHMIWSVKFSPDGRLLASGSSDHTVRIWDTTKSTLHRIPVGHSDWVHSIAFSPNGQLLASGSRDGTVHLWDTNTGAIQCTLGCHSGPVRPVAFSSDGRLLASGSDDKTVRLWDIKTGTLKQTLGKHSNLLWSVKFSPSGHLLAAGSNDGVFRLWHTSSGSLKWTLENPSTEKQQKDVIAPVPPVTFSADDRLFVSVSNDNSVRIWDTTTGTLQQTLKGHSGWVDSVAFSPNNRLLASGSHDKTIRLWNTTTGTLERILFGNSDAVSSVVFSPGGQLIASVSVDGMAELWDTFTGALRENPRIDEAEIKLEFVQDYPPQLDVQSGSGNRTSDSCQTNLNISIHHGQWIMLKGEHMLWLPHEARPSCSRSRDGMLALGHYSGQVSFMTFQL